MITVFTEKQRVPIYCWADRLDRLSLQSLQKLARWDGLAGPIAVMPDVHPAGELCVGVVLATTDCVLPTAIGDDLGCGIASKCYEFDALSLSKAHLETMVDELMLRIPLGLQTHKREQPLTRELEMRPLSTPGLEHQKIWKGRRHIGTLGGGNHFVELQKDAQGRLWVAVHSGSRGTGAAIAQHYSNAARAAGKRAPLPCLELGSKLGTALLNDFNWAFNFAVENRCRIIEEVEIVLTRLNGSEVRSSRYFDVAHNLITNESHLGKDLVVHRKGAMPASRGVTGLIPGSMGTASYLVEGLGHETSYCSSSHGAGRRMTRTEARNHISIDSLRRQMKGVVFPRNVTNLVEEAPEVYKDIKQVLSQQSELVRPILRLEPIAVIKG